MNTQILHHKQHLSGTSDELNGMMSLRTNAAFNRGWGVYSLRIENNQNDMQTFRGSCPKEQQCGKKAGTYLKTQSEEVLQG